MNRSETARVLAIAAAFDNRSVGETNVMAWTDALSDLRIEDVTEAVKLHYRTETAFLMPAQIRALVKRIRADRINSTPIPAPPHELCDDPAAYKAWHREAVRLIADGEQPDVLELPSRPVGALVAGQAERWK